MMKRSGPSTAPWGTPYMTVDVTEEWLRREIKCDLLGVGPEPPLCGALDTEVYQSGEQDVVAHGIEGCTQVRGG